MNVNKIEIVITHTYKLKQKIFEKMQLWKIWAPEHLYKCIENTTTASGPIYI